MPKLTTKHGMSKKRYQSGTVCSYQGALAARSQTILAEVTEALDESTKVNVPSVKGLDWLASVELNVPVSETEVTLPLAEGSMAEE